MKHSPEIQAQQQDGERTIGLIDKIFPPPRSFGVRLWDGTLLDGPPDPRFTLVLCHPGALRRMFNPPIELSMGEAYIYRDFDIEGDLLDAVSLVDSIGQNASFSPGEIASLLRSLRALPVDGSKKDAAHRGPADLKGEVHSLERDRHAVQYHYDVGNDFYTRWLDPDMQYSCAYFPTGDETLEEAQRLKMEYICRKLRLQPGERLLDIGCGWGGLACYAAKRYGVQVVGVTLSEEQARYAREIITHSGLSNQVRVELRDYRTLDDPPFDKMVSIGMFEHVGRSHLPEYFTQAFRMLAPGGLFLNHGISRQAKPDDLAGLPGIKRGSFIERQNDTTEYIEKKVFGRASFSQRYVFPDGELVPVSAANLVAEAAGFEVRDVENLREHYALTLHHWVRRLGEHQKELIPLVGDDVYRTWRLFLSVNAHEFDMARNGLHQSLLAKPDGGKVRLPRTREDLYR